MAVTPSRVRETVTEESSNGQPASAQIAANHRARRWGRPAAHSTASSGGRQQKGVAPPASSGHGVGAKPAPDRETARKCGTATREAADASPGACRTAHRHGAQRIERARRRSRANAEYCDCTQVRHRNAGRG
eukprot:scaffold28526_cov62-Phaeocystis_antarctica.AAC.2